MQNVEGKKAPLSIRSAGEKKAKRAHEKRKNDVLIIKSVHISTYTMAKLTEALEGENSMSKASQQLPTTKHTDA